jgi:hypothetical protein
MMKTNTKYTTCKNKEEMPMEKSNKKSRGV